MNYSGFSWEKFWWHKIGKFYLIIEAFTVGTSNDATLGLCGSTMINVTDNSKLGEEIDYTGGACLGLSEWYLVGIPEGIMLNDSYKLGEKLGSMEDESRGVSYWSLLVAPEGAIIGTNVRNYENISFDISKYAAEIIKKGPVLGLKDNIKDSDKL